MATTNFQVFDENKQNMLGDAEYLNSSQRLNGVQAGVASSQLHNKASYQTSLMAAALAQYMVSKNIDALDTDTVAGIANKIGSLFTGELVEIGNEGLAEAFNLAENDAINKLFLAIAKNQITIESVSYRGDGATSKVINTGFVPTVALVYNMTLNQAADTKAFCIRGFPAYYSASRVAVEINENATITVGSSNSTIGTNRTGYDYNIILIGIPGDVEYISGTVKYEDGTPMSGIQIIGGLSPYGGYPVTDANGNFIMQKIVGSTVSIGGTYVDLTTPDPVQITELTETVDFVFTKNAAGFQAILSSGDVDVSGFFGVYQLAAVNGGESGIDSSFSGRRPGHGGQCLQTTVNLSEPTKITCIIGAGGEEGTATPENDGGTSSIYINGSMVLETDATYQNGARTSSGAGLPGDTVLTWAGGIRPGGSGAYLPNSQGASYSGGADFGGALSGSTGVGNGAVPGGGGAANTYSGSNGGDGAVYIGWSV